jgi:ADP-ribose pyrophosphatase YjhB (NUDIX family)
MPAKHTTVFDSQTKTGHPPEAAARGAADAAPEGATAGAARRADAAPEGATAGAAWRAPEGGAPGSGAQPAAGGVPGGARPSPTHVTLAVVLQVREGRLCVLLWQRARDPFEGAWSLPGGYLEPGHDLERSIRGHLARKVDVAELSWLEQLETLGEPERHPDEWQLATAYLGLVPLGLDPALPPDTSWHPVDDLPAKLAFDHGAIVLAGRERLRSKLSYTNIGFALAPERFSVSELSGIYSAALGYPVDPTNLRRVLERRGLLEPTGERRAPGREGGRPAAVYRFVSRELAVTDPFAVLRPPAATRG